MSLKICEKCGGEIGKDEDICPYCGTDLKDRKQMDMSNTKPEMKKNKTSDVEFAGIGWRFLAWIIDMAVLYFIYFWLLIPYFLWRIIIRYWFVIGVSYYLLWYLISLLYFWILESIIGQTLGKLLLGLRTVDEDTFEKSSFIQNLINCILKCWFSCLIDFVIGVIKNSDDPQKRKRIMQNASHTVVIKIT